MGHEQDQTPLFTGLKKYASNKPIPFHIPGHKRGAGMDNDFRSFIGEDALSIDLINIAPLDDLHHPHGMIHESQKLAAKAFGADYTFFFCPRYKRSNNDDGHECVWAWRQNYCTA